MPNPPGVGVQLPSAHRSAGYVLSGVPRRFFRLAYHFRGSSLDVGGDFLNVLLDSDGLVGLAFTAQSVVSGQCAGGFHDSSFDFVRLATHGSSAFVIGCAPSNLRPSVWYCQTTATCRTANTISEAKVDSKCPLTVRRIRCVACVSCRQETCNRRRSPGFGPHWKHPTRSRWFE